MEGSEEGSAGGRRAEGESPHLMRPRNERQAIVMVKRLANVLPKCVPRTTRTDSPSTAVVRVRPKEITHRSFVGHLLNAVDRANVVERVDRRGESTVEAEDLNERGSARNGDGREGNAPGRR